MYDNGSGTFNIGATSNSHQYILSDNSLSQTKQEFNKKQKLALAGQVPDFDEYNNQQSQFATNNTNTKSALIDDLQEGETVYLMRSASTFANKLYNYNVTDLFGKDIAESKKINLSPVGPAKVAFYNYLTHETRQHTFSGTVTTGSCSDSFCFATNRYFGLDKQKCWELFKKWGFSITVDETNIYQIYKDGVLVGRIKKDGPEMNNVSFKSAIQSYANLGNYQLVCKKEDIVDIFLIAMSIAYINLMSR